MTAELLKKYRVPLLLIVAVGAVYLLTLDHGLRPDELTGGDLITHQYAQVQARFSNAPGYPLYVMLGWLWFHSARPLLGWLFNPIQVLSLYSTIWGLASLWVLYHLLRRKNVTDSPWLAAGLTLFYAVTYFFWYYSVTTEQYSSAIFQTLLLVWFAFEWESSPTDRRLLAMAFISGTMLANMLTTLFILPPLLYLIFTRRPDIFRHPKLILQTIAAGLLPVASYLFVYIRGAQHPEWRGAGEWASTAQWFWQFVSTQQGRDELAPGLTLHNLITPEYPSLVWGELTWLVLLGGLVGWLLLGKRKAIFFFGTLVIYLFFTTAYRFGNWFQVILPLYPLIVLGFGATLTTVVWRWRSVGRWAIAALLVTLIGWRAGHSLEELRIHRHNTAADTALDAGWAVLADVPSAGAEVSPAFDEWLALQYLTIVWRADPFIVLKKPGTPAEYITRNAAIAFPQLIDPAAHPQAVGGTLIHLSPQPLTELPPDATPKNANFGGEMTLRGVRVSRGGGLVMLFWSAQKEIPTDYTVSVRLWYNGQLLTGEQNEFIQDHQPVWNTYPTSRWRLGEIVPDAYIFKLPFGVHPDALQIVVYHPQGNEFENIGVQSIPINIE